MSDEKTWTDRELVEILVKGFSGYRTIVVNLLCHFLKVKSVRALFKPPLSGAHPVPGLGEGSPAWHYRAENGVVELFSPTNKGGITFEVGPTGKYLPPTPARLREYLVKQLNLGALSKRHYRPLLQDRDRFERIAKEVLAVATESKTKQNRI